jgi:OOP family OmpA-OmpF porin
MNKELLIGVALIGLLTAVFMADTAITAEILIEEDTITTQATKVSLVKTADNFIIMYDSSSSMADKYADTDMIEIDAERKILKEKNQSLPNLKWQAGIFTHTPGVGSLKYFATHLPMQVYDKAKFAAAIEALPARPSGPTLLQGGLRGLDSVLSTLTGRTVIFLFTDGQFTEQLKFPSPVEIANELSNKYDVCFYVISSATGAKGKAVIDAVAAIKTCSVVIPFDKLLHRPEFLTDALFKVSEQVIDESETMDRIVGLAVNNILFDFDKANIKPDNYTELGELIIFMQENPQAHVTLAGYTDSRGTKEYNMKLSQRRASAVRDYLLKSGIERSRITLSWFGEAKPLESNMLEAGRSKNRRVTAVITGME